MKTILSRLLFAVCITFGLSLYGNCAEKPWDHGRLKASDNGRFLVHADGTPFFWLGDTGWLLPERLDRDEAAYYLRRTAEDGFNVVQVQVINGVPAINAYGQLSHPDGWDFTNMDRPGQYGYWDHMDYIVDIAEREGIYIGMVCIWGGLVKAGLMDEQQAKAYGEFLAHRYGSRKNIVWIIGGDIPGDVKTEVWDALARSIRAVDSEHLMTFHPRGRMTSAKWFNDREWLDFNMYQSGHRRYDQRLGDKVYTIPDGTEEDVWMYVDSAQVHHPIKPVLDGEPSYEEIPYGLHYKDEPVWKAKDMRRYAYWDVFGGACGHTYGHNAVMQFARPGVIGAYFADGQRKPWYVALDDDGRKQMKHLKNLILSLPYESRVADSLIVKNNGVRYDRIIATRGDDYLLAYNHSGREMTLDLDRISGQMKQLWWMNPSDGTIHYLGEKKSGTVKITPPHTDDFVLIAIDSRSSYPDFTKD